MIAKDSTSAVNFLVLDTDGFPATGQASNITATISINGATATSISDMITEKGSGWYYFNHTFGTAGNAFITFTAANCVIMPWEEEVVEISASSAPSAADIADAVWDENITAHIDTRNKPLGYMVFYMDYIPQNVWGYSTKYVSLSQSTIADIWSMSTCPDEDDIAAKVWGRSRNAAPTRTLTAATLSNGSLSTFDPLNDTVLIDSTQAATMATATGFATPSDLAGLSTFDPSNDTVTIDATQAATMTTATGFATPSDLAGLSTFNPATDAVTINSTQAATMVTATGFATPSDIPTSDITAIKTKVNTLHNTDLTGIATGTEITAAQNAVIAAMPTIPTDYAKASDLTGLSTFNAVTDTVTINATQAATMTTATGFATPTNVTDAVSALETYGDAHWTGGGSGGGGITAEDVWKYSGTYGRSLTVSPTDISSLATKTDLTTAQTAIVNAMPSTAGLATATNVSDAKADIIAAIPDISGLSTFNAATDTVVIDGTQAATMTTATGFATPANITDAQTAIINAMPDVSGLSTFDPSTDTVILASAQTDAIASSVWSDTTIYTGNSKGNRLSGIYNTVQNIPGQVWMVDADYGATIQGTMGQAIYNMFNDHATATDVSVVADLLEQIDAGVLHWSTTATRLTLYKEDNSVLRVYALERDADGNITRINPVA